MATLRGWINEFQEAKSQPVEAIVLGGGEYDWTKYQKEDWPKWPHWNIVVLIDEVPAKILDREFQDGFGGNNSPNLCAWSADWVLFSYNYDGSEGPAWVPRGPVDHEPIRPGGG